MRSIPYITALTEGELTPNPNTKIMGSKVNSLFYPSKGKGGKAIGTNLENEIIGALMPIVYSLNKGKSIAPKSPEHRILKELLMRINK